MDVPEHLIRRAEPIFLDGAWTAGDGETIEVVDPSRGEVFATVAGASSAQVGRAAEAAARAFPAWRDLPGAERARHLEAIADGLRRRRDGLARLTMLNNGKPRGEAETDLDDAAECLAYYAGLARGLDEPAAAPLSDPAYAGLRRAVAVGPVGLIVPWNFPLTTAAWKLGPALAAGCTIVLKVSEMTPFAELAYGDIAAETGLPPGVLNILTGAAETGRALTADPRFRKLSFTGSNDVGARVMAAAAERTVPVSLELGGKSPIVVTADADTEAAVDLIAGGIFTNCGQMCSATSRLIVEEAAADRILDALVARAEATAVGPPQDDAGMGPVTTRPQYDRLVAYLERARATNGRCLTGGAAIDRTGQFVQPTIYDGVAEDGFLWRDELFGPILSVRRCRDDDEAVALANDTRFGLAATVVSGDPERAIRIGRRIEAGHVWINTPQVILPDSLWGGFRASGIGRELGLPGLASYRQSQILTMPAADVEA